MRQRVNQTKGNNEKNKQGKVIVFYQCSKFQRSNRALLEPKNKIKRIIRKLGKKKCHRSCLLVFLMAYIGEVI